MTEDRLAQVEQQLARVMDDLERTRAQLRTMQQPARRPWRHVWLLVTLCMAALAAGSLGTSSAATGAKPLTVQAPFRVVDASGALVMQVTSKPYNGIELWHSGKLAATMAARSDNDNLIKVYDAQGTNAVSLQTRQGSGEVVIGRSGTATARLGERDGKIALRFFNGDKVVSAIGVTDTGGALELKDLQSKPMVQARANANGGAVLVFDAAGHIRTSNEIDASGAGAFEIRNAGGQVVGNLSEHALGGYLGLAAQSGNAVAEAGVLPGNIGVMRVYPQGGLNWYIKGKQ